MGIYGKLWEFMGIYWKLCGFMVFIGDLWEIMGIDMAELSLNSWDFMEFHGIYGRVLP